MQASAARPSRQTQAPRSSSTPGRRSRGPGIMFPAFTRRVSYYSSSSTATNVLLGPKLLGYAPVLTDWFNTHIEEPSSCGSY